MDPQRLSRRGALAALAALPWPLMGWPLPLAAAAPNAQDAPLRIYGMESKPISFMGETGPSGMTVEVAQHILQRLGRQDPIEIVPWARANTLALNQPNIVLLSIIRTPERERHLTFVGPVFVGYISVYTRKGEAAKIAAMGDGIYRLRGGARRGSVFVQRARASGYSVTDEPVSSELCARMLMGRRFDLWFDGDEIIGHALEQAGYTRNDVELVRQISKEDINFAFSSGTPQAIVQGWDAALREMKRDGSYQKIHRKWLPRYQLPPDARAAESSRP